MAKEWYLLTTPYDQLSGYETDAFDDFAAEGFAEALDSFIGIDVELYSNDMSECTAIRAVIQRTVQDTKLNAMNRHMLVPIGTCKAGMYVKYKNRFWLITNIVDDNGMYEKAVLAICNYLLTWMTADGEVVQRWANVLSASQYNNGETEHRYYTLKTDQLLISLSNDEKCVMLESGQRFIIDKRIDIYSKEIPDDIVSDTSFHVITYEITRNDSVLYNYEDSGHYEILVTQDEQHESDGYYVIDGNGYWLCPYPYPSVDNVIPDRQEPEVTNAKIVYDSDTIYLDLGAGEFTAVFYDSDGNVVEGIEPSWEINCDFIDLLQIDYINNTIIISASDYSLLNRSFELSLKNDNFDIQSVKVNIVGLV